MLLHLLSEKIPALCRGEKASDTGIEFFAKRLLAELEWLAVHPVQIDLSGICPLDFLLLFRPERRIAVLSNSLCQDDWNHAAAVRMAEYLIVRPPLCGSGGDDDRMTAWTQNSLLARCSGPAEFVRTVLGGRAASVRLLAAPAVFHGAKLRYRIGCGSTSMAFRAELYGKDCVVKIPVPDAEQRFRNELEVLKELKHPNLPNLLGCSSDKFPYCMMEYYRTGENAGHTRYPFGFMNALNYLHRKNFLHGDIRRSNLGVRANGVPVLFDFSHTKRMLNQTFLHEMNLENEKMKCLLA